MCVMKWHLPKMDLDKFAFNFCDFFYFRNFNIYCIVFLFIPCIFFNPVIASILFVFIQLFAMWRCKLFFSFNATTDFNIHQLNCSNHIYTISSLNLENLMIFFPSIPSIFIVFVYYPFLVELVAAARKMRRICMWREKKYQIVNSIQFDSIIST